MTSNWITAFDAVKSDFNLTDDALGVFAANLRFGLDDLQALSSEAVTGGGDDKKCDVLLIDKEKKIAVVAQCYMSQRPRPEAPANKASDLNTAIHWLLSADIDKLPNELKGRADELREAINEGDIKQLYIWYVHNVECSKNVAKELETVEKSAHAALGKYPNCKDINIFAEEICDQQLKKLYEQAERTVIVTDQLSTKVSDAIEVTEGDWSTVVTVVDAKWLKNLYQKYETDLFSANLRGYLGSRESQSNINNGIKTTATEEPENFYVYNNGITALVLDYELSPRRKSGRTLTIEGISIVNGAQTTGSISSIKEDLADELKIAIRFVKSSKATIVGNVVRYNNSQNKLQAADFRSTDTIQDRLRAEFENIPDAEYEGGRRGGASDVIKRSKHTLPSYTVGQSLTAFHGEPVAAYDKKSEIWTSDKNYSNIFTDRTTAQHIVFCYSLLNEINERKQTIVAKHRKDSDSLTTVESQNLDFLMKKGANFLLVYVISQCIEVILNRPISNKFDLNFKDNITPAAGQKHWSPIVKMVLSLSSQLDDAFSRNRISNDSISKAIPKFVGVVDSLKELQKDTFDDFSKHISK